MMVVMTMVGADLHRYSKTYPEVDMMSTDAGCRRALAPPQGIDLTRRVRPRLAAIIEVYAG
jgi:hypothetical protein